MRPASLPFGLGRELETPMSNSGSVMTAQESRPLKPNEYSKGFTAGDLTVMLSPVPESASPWYGRLRARMAGMRLSRAVLEKVLVSLLSFRSQPKSSDDFSQDSRRGR